MQDRTCLLALAALSLLAWPAQAGEILVPRWAAKQECLSRTNRPLGLHVLRFHQVLDAPGLDLPGPVALKEIAYRCDGLVSNLGYDFLAELEMNLCTSPLDSEAMSATFAQNMNQDLVNVLARRSLKLTGFAKPAAAPGPFTVLLPLDKPFPLSPGANLLVETRIWQNEGGGFKNWDYLCWLDGVDQRNGPMVYFGDNCPGTAGRPAVLGMGGQISQLTGLKLYAGPNGAAAIGMLGLSRTSFGGLGLPFSLTGLGAPGCWLHIGPELLFPAQVDGNGNAEVWARLPYDYNLVGGRLYGQYLVQDPQANAFGWTASGAVEIELVPRCYTSTAWSTDSPDAATGVVSRFQGAVARLAW